MEMVQEIFKRIGEIIANNPSISNYTITGYKYLDTRLVLHFRDCNQVFDFIQIGGEELKVNSFFTKDQDHDEYMEVLNIFKENNKRDIPEQK
jgi:hypothetical protein